MPQRTYFWIYNVYLEQLLSLGFCLERIASHSLQSFLFLLLDLYPSISYWYYSLFFLSIFLSLFFYPAPSWSWGGIYKVLGGLEFISDLLILRGVLWTLDKDLLKSLCIWTHENQIVFCVIIMFSGLTELPTFEVSSEQFWCHRHLRPPGCGRGGAYLSFGSMFN
jgi:hypothetical protein